VPTVRGKNTTPSLIELNKRLDVAQWSCALVSSVDDDEGAYRKFIQDHGINFLTSRDTLRKNPRRITAR